MSKHLYEVTLNRGRNNRNYFPFLSNMGTLRGKGPDFGGINNVCLVAHHLDAKTLHLLCTEGFDGGESDLTVVEITRDSLDDEQGHHRIYTDLIENYFLPYGTFPKVKRRSSR